MSRETENAFNDSYETQFMYSDYESLSTSERMEATAAARNAARGWQNALNDSPWMALDADDPRRSAFETEWRKWN